VGGGGVGMDRGFVGPGAGGFPGQGDAAAADGAWPGHRERDQSRSQAAETVSRAEALRGQLAEATEQLAKASARAGTLAEGLAVAVGSAQSAQAMAS
jgi:hypothetical protein